MYCAICLGKSGARRPSNQPRRSGEACPIGAIRQCNGRRRYTYVRPNDHSRALCDTAGHIQALRRGGTAAMTGMAVSVVCMSRDVIRNHFVCRRSIVLMLVVPNMRRVRRTVVCMLAVRSSRSPEGLQRQAQQQENGDPSTHGGSVAGGDNECSSPQRNRPGWPGIGPLIMVILVGSRSCCGSTLPSVRGDLAGKHHTSGCRAPRSR